MFILPDQLRFSANFSTITLPGLRLPHLGVCIIGEMLRKRGHDVTIIEEKIDRVKPEDFVGVDLVGISIQTITAIRGYQLARYVKKALKVPVVAGGTHATLNTEEVFQHDFDFVVRNEGEYTFLELIEALEQNLPFDDILGLSYKDGDEIYHNADRPFVEDLDSLPFPNWHLMKDLYNRRKNPMNYNLYPLQVSRGCPFNCTFCSITPCFGKKWRFRSVENVIQELKENKQPSQGYYFFYDDNLVGNKKYMKELLAAMIDNDIAPYGWHSQMRADASLDPELMDLMQQTNCLAGTFGFESINEASLKSMKKSQDTDLIKHCIKVMHDHEIIVNGFFVFGFDDDTVQTIRDTVKFAQDNYVDVAGFMPLTPFPGTVLGEDMKSRTFSTNWELFDVQHVVYYPKNMTPLELYDETLKSYPRFYNPSRRKVLDLGYKKKGLFDMIMDSWPKRAFRLYEMEIMANARYVKWLKSLPAEMNDSIKDFRPEDEWMPLQDEWMPLHEILKRRFEPRTMRWVFEAPRKVRTSRKKRKVTASN
ncbi:MAG: B12-binding domain-containing radical SAM protein [Candidatus Helarchaeota archaeon]